MKEYYRTLELKTGAGKDEIKKAYFRLIRKYRPDSNPQEFKEVREAYEYLMDDKNRNNYGKLLEIQEPFQDDYRSALKYIEEGRVTDAIEICQKVLEKIDIAEFQILLGESYLDNHNSMKAAKVFELLSMSEPDNDKYKMLLGAAYAQRGWYKKALNIFQTIEAGDYKSIQFYEWYIQACLDTNKQDKAAVLVDKMSEYIGERKSFSAETIDKISYIYLNVLKEFATEKRKEMGNIISQFIRFIEEYADQKEDLAERAHLLMIFMVNLEYMDLVSIEQIKKLVNIIEEQSDPLDPDGKTRIESSKIWLEKYLFSSDSRITPIGRDTAAFFYTKWQGYHSEVPIPFMDSDYLEAKYIMLQNITDCWGTLVLIKEEYPILAEYMGDFLSEVLDGRNKEYLRNKYEKKLKMSLGYSANDILLEKKEENLVYDSDQEGTYRRENPKIGRNDPCPCGSGKKYKKCCGKNL